MNASDLVLISVMSLCFVTMFGACCVVDYAVRKYTKSGCKRLNLMWPPDSLVLTFRAKNYLTERGLELLRRATVIHVLAWLVGVVFLGAKFLASELMPALK